VHDVPYNGDPAQVRPVDGAREALDRLRAEGVRLAIVSNQSGVARGLLTRADVDAVNARVAELLGPFEAVHVCTHGPDEGCECRKPAPGLLERACAEAGVPASRTVMIGDIGADVEAATAAGVSPILVPTAETLPAEVAAAPRVATSLPEAVLLVLGGAW
jgi:histidinol-phosphate phosphatase family protein